MEIHFKFWPGNSVTCRRCSRLTHAEFKGECQLSPNAGIQTEEPSRGPQARPAAPVPLRNRRPSSNRPRSLSPDFDFDFDLALTLTLSLRRTDAQRHIERLAAKTRPRAANGRGALIVEADRDANVMLVRASVVGRVEGDPAEIGDVGFAQAWPAFCEAPSGRTR